MYICKYCGGERKSKNSLAQHEIRCKCNPNRKNYNHFSDYIKEHVKGTTKENNPVVAKQAESLKKSYEEGKRVSYFKNKPGTFLGKKHTEDQKRKIGKSVSITRKKHYADGTISPARGVGRGKYSYFIYNNKRFLLRSTYEFIYAFYLAEKNINFDVEAIRLPAKTKNIYAETFISDFSWDNNIVEIKGIKSGKDKYIKETFELAGYIFTELFEKDICKIKDDIQQRYDIDSVINLLSLKSDEKNYLEFDFSKKVNYNN